MLIDGVASHLSNNHELTIFGITHHKLPELETINGVEYIRVPKENYVFNIGIELAKKRAKMECYDLIHVFNRPRDLLVYKNSMPESRFVLSLHNEMFNEGKISIEMGNLVIKAVDKIMTISEYIEQTMITRFPTAKRKVKTVYSGIDLDLYKPIWDNDVQLIRKELRQKYGVDEKRVVLFVGRLSAVKGPDILIKAMHQIIEKYNDSVLVIVGSKWFSEDRVDEYGIKLYELSGKLGKDKVVFTGFIAPSEIPSHFLIGDLFVCSSQWQEPLARVHYEAMGTGLPIITTKRGGNAEIIKHLENGYLIEDYTNSDAFVEAITYLFSNKQDADKIAKAGRAFVEKNFGFSHVSNRLESLYIAATKVKK
ncbi:glycosyltransferase family 4 protein [Bacillus sp. EAC]|uniref:glycosyltransferase family 4 protein n=1 Tax=Bacillus sp. EAC TaxID=1978338 RepID=UPI000B433D41|nr:glycosyltransferase family 4 protein [Bacillus sp. EAC]